MIALRSCFLVGGVVLLPLLVGACVDAPPLAPYPVTPLAVTGPLRAGTACLDVPVPTWQIDEATRTAKLSDDSVTLVIPTHLTVTLERPELLILSGARNGSGPQPRFELAVTPRCETVNARSVLQRMAARSLAHRYKPADVYAVFERYRGWKAPFEGNTELIAHGDLLMNDAQLALTLVYKPLAILASYDVILAAGCPRYEDEGRRCLRDERLLAKATTIVAPPIAAPVAAPSPVAAPAE